MLDIEDSLNRSVIDYAFSNDYEGSNLCKYFYYCLHIEERKKNSLRVAIQERHIASNFFSKKIFMKNFQEKIKFFFLKKFSKMNLRKTFDTSLNFFVQKLPNFFYKFFFEFFFCE